MQHRQPPAGAVAQAAGGDLERLTRADCMELLSSQRVGRLAWQAGDRILVFPFTYAVQDGGVVLCTASEAVLEAVTDGRWFSFEVDDLEPALRVGWSVLLEGPAHVITEPAGRARVEEAVRPWRRLHCLQAVRLEAVRLTGRRICEQPGRVRTVYVTDEADSNALSRQTDGIERNRRRDRDE